MFGDEKSATILRNPDQDQDQEQDQEHKTVLDYEIKVEEMRKLRKKKTKIE